jgi:predicted nucleic acid-binding protein
VPGYLLDSNHISALYNGVAQVVEHARAVRDAQMRASAITCGEFEGGLRMTAGRSIDQSKREKNVKWFNEKFLRNVCDVTATTRLYYAEIVEAIFSAYPKPKKRQKTERYLVEQLGVDINDVWMAACALEHGLILVTRDGMDKIRQAVEPEGLKIENWIDGPPVAKANAPAPPSPR